MQLFNNTLNKIEVLKENFKDLISKIDLLEIKIKVILGKEKQEVLTNKKIKNFNLDVLLGYKAIVRKLISSKVDITKNLESYQNDDIANIVIVAKYMDDKGEIYTPVDKAKKEDIVGKGNWMIAKRNAQNEKKNKEENANNYSIFINGYSS